LIIFDVTNGVPVRRNKFNHKDEMIYLRMKVQMFNFWSWRSLSDSAVKQAII